MKRTTALLSTLLALVLALVPNVPARAAITVDVTQYGANGADTLDDTAAFQNALSALNASGGGVLNVPAGTYYLRSDAISIRSGITVNAGGATITPSTYGWSFLTISGGAITINGLVVDANKMAVHGIEVGRATRNLKLEGVAVRNVTQPTDPASANYYQIPVGIRIEGDGDSILLDNVQIKNVYASHRTGSSTGSMVARGLLLDNGGGAGGVSTNVTVQNSIFDTVSPKDDGDCLVIQGGYAGQTANLQVSNNTFTGCAKRAVKIQVDGAYISGNYIYNPFLGNNPYITSVDNNTFDMYAGISLYANHMRVYNNQILGVGSYYNGIEIGAGTKVVDIVVDSNQISNGTQSNISTPSSHIRTMTDVDGLTITNNTMDYAKVGLYLNKVYTNLTLSNNSITNTTYPVIR